MALRQRPVEIPKPDERRIEQIIEKGGTVATEQSKRKKQSNFPLRFMQDTGRAQSKGPGSNGRSPHQSIHGSTRQFLRNSRWKS